MRINYGLHCCGIKELDQLANAGAEANMHQFCQTTMPDPEANKVMVEKVQARALKLGVSWYNLIGIQNPPVEAYVVFNDPAQYARFRYAIFSEAHYRNTPEDAGPTYGRDFARFITSHKLGEVICTGRHINPNSSNLLRAWIWTVDWDQLRTWYATELKKKGKTLWDTLPASSGPEPAAPVIGPPSAPLGSLLNTQPFASVPRWQAYFSQEDLSFPDPTTGRG